MVIEEVDRAEREGTAQMHGEQEDGALALVKQPPAQAAKRRLILQILL